VYEIDSKIFFFYQTYFRGVILDLDKYIFPWQTYFLGGQIRLQLSCIWANMVFKKKKWK